MDIQTPAQAEAGSSSASTDSDSTGEFSLTVLSGSWKDFFKFVGPGWLIAIAACDPGNYQANIQSGALSEYRLIFTTFYMSLLSLYMNFLGARLSTYSQMNLAQVQHYFLDTWLCYFNWIIAEITTIITDIPEIIAMGIAIRVLFGVPSIVGVVVSLFTTMVLLLADRNIKLLEIIVGLMLMIMATTLIVDSGITNLDAPRFMAGWWYGFVELEIEDMWSVIGIIGCVCMPHNLYLQTNAVFQRPVKRDESTLSSAFTYTAIEPSIGIMIAFVLSACINGIAAETVFGMEGADEAGINDFDSFLVIPGSAYIWAVSLLFAGQAAAITTTYSGQIVMEGFVNIRLKSWQRALITRAIAIIPCVIVAVVFEGNVLNQIVNYVNVSLAFLLPFALTPLVKYGTSRRFLGKYAPRSSERYFAWCLAFCVYGINAVSLSLPGGGFFGDLLFGEEAPYKKSDNPSMFGFLMFMQVLIQIFYLGWNVYICSLPIDKQILDPTCFMKYKHEYKRKDLNALFFKGHETEQDYSRDSDVSSSSSDVFKDGSSSSSASSN